MVESGSSVAARRSPAQSVASEASAASIHNQASNKSKTYAWFCPSRWHLTHHDTQANIDTFSSHMCLADLHSDGESLLALVDFKRRYPNDLDLQQVTDANEQIRRGKE